MIEQIEVAPTPYAVIPLRARDGSVRAVTIVDAEDADHLNQWRWSLHSGGYVFRGTLIGGVRRTYFMHRELMGLAKGDRREVDHTNHDRLDNRRGNLRIVPRKGNLQNTSSQQNKTSKFRGVHWKTEKNKWYASLKMDGKHVHLGCFDDELEAAAVAEAARIRHFPWVANLPNLSA